MTILIKVQNIRFNVKFLFSVKFYPHVKDFDKFVMDYVAEGTPASLIDIGLMPVSPYIAHNYICNKVFI